MYVCVYTTFSIYTYIYVYSVNKYFYLMWFSESQNIAYYFINEVLKEQDKSAFSINIVFVLFIC